jgi:hypothetical protein
MFGAKSGMQQMIEQMIPPEAWAAIEKAKVEIPAFAEQLNKRVTAMEQTLKSIDGKLSIIMSKLDPNAVEDVPPTLKKLLEQMPTTGQERSF